ncbi:MAG: transposase [Steroidobacter sp.]
MPRKPRLHVPGAFYHVTLRGNHRQDIFFAADDRKRFEGILAPVVERFAARVHAYCWMTNHVHILIQVSNKPLGALIQRVAGQYARQLQKGFNTTGHLFERRYHAVIVDADAYLLELVRYIHLNPVRAKLVDEPDRYLWTSHHAYLGSRQVGWLHTEFVLSLFHADPARAREGYEAFIRSAAGGQVSSISPLGELNENDRRILGDDDFLGRIHAAAWQPPSRKTIDELLEEATQRFGISRNRLIASGRARLPAKARAWVAYRAVTLRIASLAYVAALFDRDESTLRESVERYFSS